MQFNLGLKVPPDQSIPHIIKYMGSKKPIIDFVTKKIVEIHKPKLPVCDLFAGSCSISAALRRTFNFISNDVQEYSSILAHTYFSDFSNLSHDEILSEIVQSASIHANVLAENYRPLLIDYSKIKTLISFHEVEEKQRSLMYQTFINEDFYLFSKYYSGTYWSFAQCIWIDALRKVADSHKNSNIYYAIISSLMYAMSYTTQSTGHFAQYRDGRTVAAMKDIIIYRQKNFLILFKKKFIELLATLNSSLKALETTTLDYIESLKIAPERSTIYADPPYAPVHYSRFYHALETLVKYDYPELEYKGRYRIDRHQSPFSQKGKALKAFSELFDGTIERQAQLILSYSNTGVLPIEEINTLAMEKFTKKVYTLEFLSSTHMHSSMGYDKKRSVTEYLIVAKTK